MMAFRLVTIGSNAIGDDMIRTLLLSLLMLSAAVLVAAPVPKAPVDPKKESDSIEAEPAIDPAKLALDAALRAKDAANREASSDNLKKIAIAVHTHADSNEDNLANNILGKGGEPLLSWRVRLLPYLDEMELYKQVKLDEAWNGPNNSSLIEMMPKVFASPRVVVKKKGYTVYQGFSGHETVFPPSKALLFPQDITDGTSCTILAVESSTAVPWTKPQDIPFDVSKDLPAFGKSFGDLPLAAICDGGVRTLNLKKISTKTLKRAIGRNEGDVLGDDWKE
jgi:Protein of unknown function (DUF1559)